jgi:hypothetical protein
MRNLLSIGPNKNNKNLDKTKKIGNRLVLQSHQDPQIARVFYKIYKISTNKSLRKKDLYS